MTQETPKPSFRKRLKNWVFGAGCTGTVLMNAALPSQPMRLPLLTPAPKGLALAYTADDYLQADLLRQLLEQQGFHPEWVPPFTTGAFAINHSPHIFVPQDEVQPAREFIAAYQAGEPAIEGEDQE